MGSGFSILILLIFFRIHPIAGEEERDRRNDGDAGEDEPHGLRILDGAWDFIGIGDKFLHEESDVESDDKLGHEPGEIGDADVSAHAVFGSDLCDVLEETRLPHGFADSAQEDEGEEDGRGGVDGEEEGGERHDGGADDHHFVDVLSSGESGDDGCADEDDEWVNIAEGFEVIGDGRIITEAAFEVSWDEDILVSEDGLNGDEDKDEEIEFWVSEWMSGELLTEGKIFRYFFF